MSSNHPRSRVCMEVAGRLAVCVCVWLKFKRAFQRVRLQRETGSSPAR